MTQLASTACVAFVVVVVEGFDGMAAWNVFPLLLSLGSIPVLKSDLGTPEVRVAGTVFWVTEVACVLSLHLAWALDLQQLATRSSTGGLIFLVAPLYFVVLGLALAGTSIAGRALIKWARRGA